jgi:hypothetical protein
MAYDIHLANRLRDYLATRTNLEIEEKKIFGGLVFMVNGKMCVNVSDDNLMCRFDPRLTEELAERRGFLPMVMKGKEYKGYCFVEPEGFTQDKDFEYWVNLCLDFNSKVKSSKRR